MRPNDWDYYFGPHAPRRGGPLRALANLLIFGLVLGLLGASGAFAWNQYGTLQVARSQTAVAQETVNVAIIASRTARTLSTREAATAAVVAGQTATAGVAPPTPAALGLGSIAPPGGNLRREPRIAPETVIGLVWPGDEVALLEQQSTASGVWYRIRITKIGPNRAGEGVPVGTEGWASGTLLQPLP
jgi:hypothetical protein